MAKKAVLGHLQPIRHTFSEDTRASHGDPLVSDIRSEQEQ